MAARLVNNVPESPKRNANSKVVPEIAAALETVPQYRPMRHSVLPRASLVPPQIRQRVSARRAFHLPTKTRSAALAPLSGRTS